MVGNSAVCLKKGRFRRRDPRRREPVGRTLFSFTKTVPVTCLKVIFVIFHDSIKRYVCACMEGLPPCQSNADTIRKSLQ